MTDTDPSPTVGRCMRLSPDVFGTGHRVMCDLPFGHPGAHTDGQAHWLLNDGLYCPTCRSESPEICSDAFHLRQPGAAPQGIVAVVPARTGTGDPMVDLLRLREAMSTEGGEWIVERGHLLDDGAFCTCHGLGHVYRQGASRNVWRGPVTSDDAAP